MDSALIEDLTGRSVGLRSLSEQIDTTSAAGRLVLHVFGALAERTMAGLAASRVRGRVGGRPRALTVAQLAHAEALVAAGTPIREIVELLGVGRSTVYRALRRSAAENRH